MSGRKKDPFWLLPIRFVVDRRVPFIIGGALIALISGGIAIWSLTRPPIPNPVLELPVRIRLVGGWVLQFPMPSKRDRISSGAEQRLNRILSGGDSSSLMLDSLLEKTSRLVFSVAGGSAEDSYFALGDQADARTQIVSLLVMGGQGEAPPNIHARVSDESIIDTVSNRIEVLVVKLEEAK